MFRDLVGSIVQYLQGDDALCFQFVLLGSLHRCSFAVRYVFVVLGLDSSVEEGRQSWWNVQPAEYVENASTNDKESA